MLVVTSAGPGEGKTTLASNLAAASAEIGRQVLLVDADLRCPKLDAVFGLQRNLGLTELVQSSTPVADLNLDDYVQSTSVPRLSVITSGNPDGKVTGPLLFSERVFQLFSRFRQSYGVVLIDTAPALLFSDARLLGRFCDGAILVVRSGVTSREAALAAKQWLTEDGVPILGTILNDWNPADAKHKSYYYHNGYSLPR
jgi:capsular exopolysaccharide synthesis family protein